MDTDEIRRTAQKLVNAKGQLNATLLAKTIQGLADCIDYLESDLDDAQEEIRTLRRRLDTREET